MIFGLWIGFGEKRKNAEAKDVIQYSWNMIITVFSGRNGAGEARQLFHDI